MAQRVMPTVGGEGPVLWPCRFIRSERALIFELARAVGAHIVNLTEMKTCDHRHIRQACQESGLISLMVARS